MRGKLHRKYRASHELDRRGAFSGVIPVAEMARLTSLIMADAGQVEVEFEFDRTVFQHDAIRGHYRTELTTQCQRCLEAMPLAIDQSFELLIDASDEDVEALQTDTVYCEDGFLDVFEVIEDELILALPLIMMHQDTGCNRYLEPAEPVLEIVEEKPNPFAVLKSLKDSN